MFTQLQTTIYAAVKPIFKIYFIIACGYWLGGRNILTTQTCKTISGTVVLLLLPSLIFSEIVTNIGIEDLKQIGIIFLCSIALYLVGALLGLVVYYITNVPPYWMGGCISVGFFPNVAELPIAYISSFTIFTDAERSKGLSYVVMFLATYCIVQFNFGAIMLVENDFETERKILEQKQINDLEIETKTVELQFDGKNADVTKSSSGIALQPVSRTTSIQSHRSHMSNLELRQAQAEDIDDMISAYSKKDIEQVVPHWSSKLKFKSMAFIKFFLINLKRPMSIAMIISFTCSLIPWLRALFVDVEQLTYPNAPDGDPPLSFVMDICTYLSQACVPMGILVLGSTLSRLKLSGTPLRYWLTPIAITVVRTVILPIIGILITDRLHADGWFDNDRILHFVCAISWGLPCATTLIYLTAACADQDGPQMQYLACVYVAQYAVLGISLPILATWTVMKSLDAVS